jgi:hypothetical protein
MITLKNPVIIKFKNYTLIWKSKKEFVKVYNKNSVNRWYKILKEA